MTRRYVLLLLSMLLALCVSTLAVVHTPTAYATSTDYFVGIAPTTAFFDVGNPLSRITDGSDGTGGSVWCTASNNGCSVSGTHVNLDIDTGGVHFINRMVLSQHGSFRSFADTYASNDGSAWVLIDGSGDPSWTHGAGYSYRYWRLDLYNFNRDEGDFIFTWSGIYDDTVSTPTPAVATATPTPTSTNTPTATTTPLPTATGIRVVGSCGDITTGPPCWVTFDGTPQPITGTVNVGNWPTPIPTATPLLGPNQQATVQSIALGTGGPPTGAPNSGTGVSADVYSPYNGGTHFVAYTQYSFGCPWSMPIVNASFCLKYNYINQLNAGPIAIPTWPFVAVLILFVIGLVVRR